MKQETKDLQLCIEADLHAYYCSCNDLVCLFCQKYFDVITDWDWMGDIGGVLNINDYYFGMDDIILALKKKVTIKKLFEWYDYSTEWDDIVTDAHKVNFSSFLQGMR